MMKTLIQKANLKYIIGLAVILFIVWAAVLVDDIHQRAQYYKTVKALQVRLDSLSNELENVRQQNLKLYLQRYPVVVQVTAYTPSPLETSGDPLQCAWWLGERGALFDGRGVALSDELLRTIPMGSHVWLEIRTKEGWEWLGRFTVVDRSPQDYPHVDVQMFSLGDAFRFGRHIGHIYYVPEENIWTIQYQLLRDLYRYEGIAERLRLLSEINADPPIFD